MSPVPWLVFHTYTGSLTVALFIQGGLVCVSRASVCCCTCCPQWDVVSEIGMERFAVVQSCTKPHQAALSVQSAGLTGGNTQLMWRQNVSVV